MRMGLKILVCSFCGFRDLHCYWSLDTPPRLDKDLYSRLVFLNVLATRYFGHSMHADLCYHVQNLGVVIAVDVIIGVYLCSYLFKS